MENESENGFKLNFKRVNKKTNVDTRITLVLTTVVLMLYYSTFSYGLTQERRCRTFIMSQDCIKILESIQEFASLKVSHTIYK